MTLPIPNAGAPTGIVPLDPGSGVAASVLPEGAAAVSNPASQLFNDTFGSAAFDVNKWTLLNGGSGVAPTAPGTSASTTLNGGTTANSYSALVSKPTFQPTEPGFLVATHRVNLQNPTPTPSANYLAWGLMNLPSPPTFASPITDGAVFDVVNGVLFAATYAGGTRLAIANLGTVGSGLIKDTNAHKYNVRFRGDICYWTIDSDTVVVASYLTGASGPNNNTLSTGLLVVANTGATAATLVDNGSTVSDTAHTTVIICDATYGFRKANVNSGSHNVANASTYSVITTAGTTTVAQGGGIYFGVNAISTGTSFTVTPFDIIVSGTTTTTNQLNAISTAAALGFQAAPGGAGVGVKFAGALTLVTTGTGGQYNVLWD